MYGKVLTLVAVVVLVNTGWTTNTRWVGFACIASALGLAVVDILLFVRGIHIP